MTFLLTFSTRDERVDDDLCSVKEVAKLCLPDTQVPWVLNAEAILEPQHCLLTEGTVGHLTGSGSHVTTVGKEGDRLLYMYYVYTEDVGKYLRATIIYIRAVAGPPSAT